MRSSRRLVVAFILAALMSSVAVKADTGAPGGPQRGTCGFLQGILYKVGSPAVVGAIFDSVFGCDLDY